MKKNLEKFIFMSSVIIITLGSSFLYFWYYMDGISVNPLITYTQGTNPKEFKLDKTVYHRGEIPNFFSSFCKLRSYSVQITWWLINDDTGQRMWYIPEPYKNSPIGCTPPDQKALVTFPIRQIPLNATTGNFHFEGVIDRILLDGRIREEDVATTHFVVQ